MIKTGRNDANFRIDAYPVICPQHANFESTEILLDLNKPNLFCKVVCFLMTLAIKITNLNCEGNMNHEQRKRISTEGLHLLFNFIESCPREYQYYPLRALYEYF